jgi:predicted nucleotidyltransferase
MAGAAQFRYAIKMNVAFITSRLREYFEANARGVVCVYVFGSVARGTARGRSDIDVAVLLERDPPPTLAGSAMSLGGDLERHLGYPVDLVVLNRASVDLVHRVLRDGLLVFDPRPRERIQFEVRARNAYFDLKPVLDRYRKVARASSDG